MAWLRPPLPWTGCSKPEQGCVRVLCVMCKRKQQCDMFLGCVQASCGHLGRERTLAG